MARQFNYMQHLEKALHLILLDRHLPPEEHWDLVHKLVEIIHIIQDLSRSTD